MVVGGGWRAALGEEETRESGVISEGERAAEGESWDGGRVCAGLGTGRIFAGKEHNIAVYNLRKNSREQGRTPQAKAHFAPILVQ
jgi:hypothetical protein